MFSSAEESEQPATASVKVGLVTGVVLALLTIALVWLGVYPTGIIAAIKASALMM